MDHAHDGHARHHCFAQKRRNEIICSCQCCCLCLLAGPLCGASAQKNIFDVLLFSVPLQLASTVDCVSCRSLIFFLQFPFFFPPTLSLAPLWVCDGPTCCSVSWNMP